MRHKNYFKTQVEYKNDSFSGKCIAGFDNWNRLEARRSFALTGWIIGQEICAVSVSLKLGDDVISSGKVDIARPGIARHHAGDTGGASCGYRLWVDTADLPQSDADNVCTVNVRFEDGAEAELASLTLCPKQAVQPQQRTFFTHVPKTGGSSFNSFLEANFLGLAHCERFLQGRWPRNLSNVGYLRGVDFLSGHIPFRVFSQNFARRDYLMVTMLREPLLQLVSHINWVIHISSAPESGFFLGHPEKIQALSHQLRAANLDDTGVLVDMLRESDFLFQNSQSRYFQFHRKLDRDDVVENLLAHDLVGLTHRYDEFVDDYLGLVGCEELRGADLSKENVNVAPRLSVDVLSRDHRFMDFYHEYNEVDEYVWGVANKNRQGNSAARSISKK